MPWGVGSVFLFWDGWVRCRDVRSQVRKVCGCRRGRGEGDWEVVMVMVRVLLGVWVWVRVFTVHDIHGMVLFGGEESGVSGRLNVQIWFREVIWMLNPEMSRMYAMALSRSFWKWKRASLSLSFSGVCVDCTR